MTITIDFSDVRAASFVDKESGEVKNYKEFAVAIDDGAANYISMSGVVKILDGLKRIA